MTRRDDYEAAMGGTTVTLNTIQEIVSEMKSLPKVFERETLSTAAQAALMQLENLAVLAATAEAARRDLAVHLYDQGVPADDVLLAAQTSRPTLTRWKRLH